MKGLLIFIFFVALQIQLASQVIVTGPSTSESPFLLPVVPQSTIISILTVGDMIGSFKMCGPPDGLGAFENQDSTFTLLMNHEIPPGAGIPRAHGSPGAFVTKWIIRKKDLKVLAGSDLVNSVHVWNGSSYQEYNSSSPGSAAMMAQFCSADLPAQTAYYNKSTGKGTLNRIFMNGEENSEGRAFAHIVNGTEAGHSYQLPDLGKLAFENVVANPLSQDLTLLALLDDTSPGQLYFYVGTKKNTGSDIVKAGLTQGKLYGVKVQDLPYELNSPLNFTSKPFTLVDLGSVTNMSGSTLNQRSIDSAVTLFFRPEDGAWDPTSPNNFYFNTTNAFSSPSRLWKVSFSDLNDPVKGGSMSAVLDGTEGQHMLDNITINENAYALLQEDPAGPDYLAKMYGYDLVNDELTTLAEHDPKRFTAGAPNYLSESEESTGILSMQHILGAGWYLLCVQSHNPLGADLVEGGQLLAFYDPATVSKTPVIKGEMNDWELYPNPCSNFITLFITSNDDQQMQITMTDLAGKIVSDFREEIRKGSQKINIQTEIFESGAYILKVRSVLGDKTFKLFIFH